MLKGLMNCARQTARESGALVTGYLLNREFWEAKKP